MLYRTCCHEFRDSPFPIVLWTHCVKEQTRDLFKHLTWNLNYYVIWLFGWYSWQEWLFLTMLSCLPSNRPQLFSSLPSVSSWWGWFCVIFLDLCLLLHIWFIKIIHKELHFWHGFPLPSDMFVAQDLNCWNGYYKWVGSLYSWIQLFWILKILNADTD